VRFLLDTHCWLWQASDPDRLSHEARELLGDPANEILVSAASSWEIAIKYATGRLSLPEPPQEFVPKRFDLTGASPLAIEHAHAVRVAELPMHHKDPFDRMLIAQAQVEGTPIMTVDRRFEPYDVDVRWAN
jgi:PIN domain nuclease of toxin-antitoxin system